MNTKAAEQKLLPLYEKWFNEVNNGAPDFFTDKDYSCPYYIGIPHGWFESEVRVLIVAENGFGYYGNGKEEGISPSNYSVLQKINLGELQKAVNNPDEGEHPFWTRTRRICNYGFPVAWTAIDKICFRRDRKSKLSDADRERLHAVEKRVLAEEIEILNPTIVFFFGWHEISLAHELPDIYAELYPEGKGDNSKWKNSIVSIKKNRTYVFTYNPHNPYWKDKPADYEDKVIAVFKSHVAGRKPSSKPDYLSNDNMEDALIKHEAKMRVRKLLRTCAAIIAVIVLICYAINPVLGIISIATSVIYMLIMIALSGSMYKQELKRMKLQSEQTFASSAQITQNIPAQRGTKKQSVMEALDNPVVKVAASYAIGKAVLEASKKTESYQRNHRNPNADRYEKAIREAWESSGPKYRADEHICATCTYWGGERQFVNSGNKKYVRPKRNAGSAKCSKMCRTIHILSDHCCYWKGI